MSKLCRFALVLIILSGGRMFSQDLDGLLSASSNQLTSAQLAAMNNFSIEIDTVYTDIGIVGGSDLTGYNTYRLYVATDDTADVVNAIYGNIGLPLYLSTTGNFFQDPLGAITPDGINPFLYDISSSLIYDSWLTIGIDSVPVDSLGQGTLTVIESSNSNWQDDFESGNSFFLNDLAGGGIFQLPSMTNGTAGADKRVLIAQLTTNGEITGTIQTQVFLLGDNQENTLYLSLCVNDVDSDGDGICDGDEVVGCQDSLACNFDVLATDNDLLLCNFITDSLCEECVDGVIELIDENNNDICDSNDIAGCTDSLACNYDDTATVNDGSCELTSCAGCTDDSACNFDTDASIDDGSCTFPAADNLDCDGNCLNDADSDSICDEDEITGCTNAAACNYSADATDDDGSCTFPAADNLDCDGNCLNDADSDGICDEDEITGCTNAAACNYSADATDDDGSCTFADAGLDCDGNCLNDADSDGTCDEDEITGCTDAAACNYSADATDDDGSCTFADAGLDCDGNCLNDADSDGICDEDEITGCTDAAACNYSADATDDDGSCTFADANLDCDGNCLNDADSDGICDEDEITGCTDVAACNYSADATDDDGSCTFADANLDCDGNCLNDADSDGICDEDEITGCTDAAACNYSADATDDDGSCTFPAADNLDCDGNCLNDADSDGICDEDEITGCTDSAACNYSADATDDDGSCNFADAGLDCDGNCLNDADSDGICDEDEITGCTDVAACNYSADATDDDGSCTFADAGLDCDGNCLNDADSDGICDEDEITGCTDVAACNYSADATDDDGSCNFADAGLDCDGNCLNDADSDSICDEDEITGCTDAAACNYNADATDEDSSCEFTSCSGCTDATACNYDETATIDDFECTFPAADNLDCDGNCLNDADSDSICDEDEITGCTDAAACNYSADATDDDGSCTFPAADNLDCDGNCLNDADSDGICDEDEITGCTNAAACNYSADATDDDGSCTFADAGLDCDGNCLNDADSDGICDEDEITGCTDAAACNYSAGATDDDGSCTFADAGLDCDGNCLNDADSDGICDEDEITGCTDAAACNYSADATDDDGSCNFADAGLDCDGNCLNDADSDGICDEDEITGCTDVAACNYSADATDDDGSCTFADAGLDCDGNCLNDADSDGICDEDEITGCTNAAACNYSADATDDDGSCTFADANLDCDGNCLNDADSDGICDEDEITGCTNAAACNYSADATDDDGSCTFADANLDCDGNCLNDADSDGICDEDEITGCTNAAACNYSADATDDDGSCTFADANLDCDGNCLNDADSDGICDEDEITGCTDVAACNYSADATDDDGSCTFADAGLDCDGNCLNDADSDGICDEDEITGCTDAAACNYDADATDEDSSCEFTSCSGCTDAAACNYDETATIDDGECTFAEANLDCDGNCLNDADSDGICNEDEIPGCTDAAACNFDAAATDDDSSCTFPAANLDCDGNCLNDTDGDQICDEDEILGCTDAAACNFDASATDDDGSCESTSCAGCTNSTACNYDADATLDDDSCEFPEPGFDCAGNELDDCDPGCLLLSESLDPQILGCPDDLSSITCNDDLVAINNCTGDTLLVNCGPLQRGNNRNTCTATTALGIGQDGAIVLFGITMYGLESQYFVPSGPGLTFEEADLSGTALLTGEVSGVNNPNERWDVHIMFEDAVSGADWQGGFKSAMNCTPTPDITDAWTIYTMKPGMSVLSGAGDLEGSVLNLIHAPANEYFGFQVGEMANDRNCNYGAGGWFSWEGQINGNSVYGSNGDVLVDLECGQNLLPPCSEDLTLIYSFADPNCGGAPIFIGQDFTYQDTIAPTFDNPPTDVTVSCSDALPALTTLTATDNCSPDEAPTVTFNGQALVDSAGPGCYTLERSWLATDACGNTAIHTQTITVEDNTPPVIADGQNGSGECGSSDAALSAWLANRGGATLSDDCGAAFWVGSPSMVAMAGGCGSTGTTTYAFTASDECGNESTIELVFGIVDTTPPTVNGSQDYDIVCGDYSETEIYGITATDACSDEEDIQITIDSVQMQTGTCPIVMFRTYRVEDACENVSFFEQAVNLYDSIAPVLTITSCPADDTLFVDALCGADTSVLALGELVIEVTDACDPNPQTAVTHADSVSSDCAGGMVIVRTWTATAIDACDNADAASCTQTITVIDATAPTLLLTPPADTTLIADADCGFDASAEWLGLPTIEANDACDNALTIDTLTVQTDSLSSCAGNLSFTRSWIITATDDCGNSTTDTCSQAITIEDQSAPIITLTDTLQIACDLLVDSVLYAVDAEDNCSDVDLIIESHVEDTAGCAGSILRTYRATDACNNTVTANQVIQLVDTVAPVVSISCPAGDTLYVDSACAADTTTLTLGVATAEASDACSTPNVVIQSSDTEVASCSGSKTITRIWQAVATDPCGNSDTATCEQIIVLIDTLAPSLDIVCPADADLYSNDACFVDTTTAALGVPALTTDDNCDLSPAIAMSYVDTVTSEACPGTYSFTRTWTVTATDDCNNATTQTCDQLITVSDTLAPVVTADIEVTMDCSVYSDSVIYGISATDNCSAASIAITSSLEGSGACAGTWDRTYTITDECGNSTTFEQFIHLTDSIAPEVEILCPAADTLFVDMDCMADTSVTNLGMATASCTDNCDALPQTEITYTDALTPLCAGNTLLERTWMAVGEDHCQNTDTATCVQTILLMDTIAPELTITCPDTATVALDDLCEAIAPPSLTGEPTPLPFDNCDGPVSTESSYVDGDTVSTCGSAFNFTRTWTVTATDSCGNSTEASCDQLIQVVDASAPDWAGALLYSYGSCDELTDPTDPTQMPIEATDNCDEELTYTIETQFFSGGCPGSWERIWTATDDCGNSSSVSQFVSLFDVEAPEIECPIDTLVYLDADCQANLADSLLGSATAMDNCTAAEDIAVSYTDSLLSVDCAGDDDMAEGSRTILRTFTAIDACDNATDCAQTIQLLDTLAPAGTVLGDTIACELYDSSMEYGSASGTDNCDSDVAYSWAEDSVLLGDCDGNYEVHRLYTFVDDCGNSTEVMQTLIIVDETAPVITGDMVAIVACHDYDANPDLPYITAEDNCSGVIITFEDMPFSGGCVQPAATFMREYVVSDSCGNQAFFSQFIELIDTVPPGLMVMCPEPIELFSDENCAVDTDTSLTGSPTINAFDNCCVDIELTTVIEDGPADTLCLGSYSFTRTFTVTAEDDCFNTTTTSCTQLITVTDTVPPTLDCPADLTVECDGNGNAAELEAWLSSVSAPDNCSPVAITNDYAALSDSCGATGDVTVTFTAVDSCQNSISCSATFTIVDTEAPVIEPAVDLTVQCGADNDSTLAAWLADNGGAAASDICSGVTWSNNFIALNDSCGATGSALVNFTATDDCGNADSTQATFTIIDTIAPVFADTGYNYTIACDLYEEDAVYVVTATDECGLAIITVTDNFEVSGTCPAVYSRTYTASDACGNQSTFMQTISTIDTVAPVFDFIPEDYTALCSEEHPLELATATDNCADSASVSITVVADTTAGDCPQAYTVTRTFTAEDECQNTTTATQVITVIDTVAPTFVEALPADTTVNCHDVPEASTLTATDLCQDVLVVFTEDTTAGDCPQAYTLTRTWTVADDCGNTTDHVQTVSVQDTIAPSIDTPAGDLVVECDGAGNTDAFSAWVDSLAGAGASDLCGMVSILPTDTLVVEDCDGAVSATTVTFTAADECNNASTTSATFTILDTTLPTAEGDSLVQVMCADYSDSVIYSFSAADQCSDVVIAISDSTIEGPCAGAYERTYTVSDACENSIEFTQIIHLYDSIAPVFTYVPADTTLLCNEAWDLDSLGTALAEDNCLGSVTISFSDSVLAADSLDVDCYVIDRLWTATDICGNEKSVTQTITIADTLAPSLTVIYPADATLVADDECAAETSADSLGMPAPSADDNCDLDIEITILPPADSIAPTCGGAYELHRLWVITAEDNCGNITTESATQVITVLDEGAPTLTAEAPADQTILQTADCDVYLGMDSLGTVSYTATDACDTNVMVTVTYADGPENFTCTTEDSLAQGDYNFVRTFTVIATDACDNADTVFVTQSITVLDQIAPQFTGTCDIENGASIDACCEDHNGVVVIPEACEIDFMDNCDTEVELMFTESTSGDYAPNDSVVRYCTATLPEAFADGETCSGLDPHSLRLFNLPGGAEFYVATSPGTIEHRPDSTWVLTQSVMALDGSGGGWDISVTYDAAMDWDAWSNQDIPTSFKRDCGDLIDDHENWEYRIMTSGTLTGTGVNDGNFLSLNHSPANHYYAFQLGLGANNMNNNFGYSGWFTYFGTFNGMSVMGSGDLFGDMDCCLPWSIDRNYLIMDDCGNANQFEYTVSVNGGGCLGDGDAQASGNGGTDHTPGILGGAGDLTVGKTPIRVTNLQPNPTNDWSQLGFEVTGNMRVTITMYTMDGVLVTQLFDGFAGPGVNHSLDIPADELQSGMYQIKLSNSSYMIVKKLLVTE